MPRSSRHKSSKHSSKEAREYSDSSKDSPLKDRKNKDETSIRVSKESNSGEKRKVEVKDALNGEEYNSSSKRRKERVEESVNDRWNGGEDEAKKPKEKRSESRSKKRDGSGESEDAGKKRRESRDVMEREKKGRDYADKIVSDKTDSNVHNLLRSPDSENQHDRRNRRKRDGDGDRHHDNVDVGRQLTSKEDTAKDVRSKYDKHKDERFRDKYHEDLDRENRHREDKHRDERVRDRGNNRSDEKRGRDEKETVETRQKKSLPPDEVEDHDRDYDAGRNGNWDREYYLRDRDRDRDRERDRDRDREMDRERDKEREHERDKDRDRNNDHDRAYLDDRNVRVKDSRWKKRSSDDFDDYDDVKHKGIRNSADNEKKSSSKIETDADRGRSQIRQSHVDNISNNRRRLSPNPSSHGASDDYRSSKAEDSKYKDSQAEQRPKAASSREVAAFSSERVSKYRSSEKPIKMDDGNIGELSVERSSSLKASPKGLADRSPSSSLERRYMNRNSARRSLEIEESGRRSRDSMGARDLPSAEDRSNREMQLDEWPSDASFYNRSSQSNSSLIPPSSFRGGVGSPSFAGSVEEDGRVNSGGRYKRSDPMSGRGQGNVWRGGQNWSSPVPNGYIPFQHGPSHGGFQAMMPQFPSPPLFGVRPPMDINHSGIPYHMQDADRFSGHLRPLGWQNMMDGSGTAHMHGWDGNNGVFRDEAHFYGGAEWDQNRHPMNGRGWESGADMWKGQNGNLPSTSHKEDATVHAPSGDVPVGQTGQKSQKENNSNNDDDDVEGKYIETKPAIASTNEFSKISSTTYDKMVDAPTMSSDDNIFNVSRAYLSKLDISEKLASPELFEECIGLHNKQEITTESEDTAMLVNLKDGARVVAKSSNTLWSSYLFPATNNSVFQRALNIYKKQRVCSNDLPIVNGGIVDAILASNSKDEIPPNDVDKVESPTSCCNVETADAALPDTDEKAEAAPEIGDKVEPEIDEKAEAALNVDETAAVVLIAAPHAKSGERDLAAGNDFDASNADAPHELPDEAYSHCPNPVLDDSEDKVDGVLPEMPSLEENSVAETADVMANTKQSADGSGEMKGKDSSVSAEEGKGIGESGPLVLSDGSPNASGTMMSGSNESESVILSRIHHSPESTH